MSRRRLVLAVLLLVVSSSCGGGGGGGAHLVAPSPPPDLALETVPGSFDRPLLVTAPRNDARLFVVEKTGKIQVVKNGGVLPTPFLDLSARVTSATEQGLLGLAFDPQYATNGRFFVTLTDVSGQEELLEFHADPHADVADPTATVLLAFDHPTQEHNAGMLEFGPDGMLYASFGDGGEDNDLAHRYGQTTTDLLGDLVRLDVRSGALVIPPDNPFQGAGQRHELWSIGLRNPWRFSFDRATGDLYIGDVGEASWEEIDVAPGSTRGRGANFGWNTLEGSTCFDPATACNTAGLTPPTITYSHTDGCAVVGGYVYRGGAIAGLQGTYFYTDYCRHEIRSFYWSGGTVSQQRTWPGLDPGDDVLSFGEDAAGELYLCTQGGRVLKIVPAAAARGVRPGHDPALRASRARAPGTSASAVRAG